mgnify:CR=1 FL=1
MVDDSPAGDDAPTSGEDDVRAGITSAGSYGEAFRGDHGGFAIPLSEPP